MQSIIQSILCTTDFSDVAANAIRTAAGIARRQDAVLHLLHADESHLRPQASDDRAPHCDDAPETADARLCRLVNETEERYGIRCVGRVVEGAVSDAVIGYAQGYGCDLIVMGTRALEGVRQFSIGTHAHAVLRRSMKPLLVVPAGATADAFRNILFPVRAVPKSTEKYAFLRPIIARNGAALHMVAVSGDSATGEAVRTSTAARLLARQLEADGVNFTLEQHPCQNASECIVQLAEEKAVDLVVITATLEADFLGLFSGSFTKDLMRRATTAVMFLRPDGDAASMKDRERAAAESLLPGTALHNALGA